MGERIVVRSLTWSTTAGKAVAKVLQCTMVTTRQEAGVQVKAVMVEVAAGSAASSAEAGRVMEGAMVVGGMAAVVTGVMEEAAEMGVAAGEIEQD
jgi:hypothetical protein